MRTYLTDRFHTLDSNTLAFVASLLQIGGLGFILIIGCEIRAANKGVEGSEGEA